MHMKNMNKNNQLDKIRTGLILFAHGSRNPHWRKPFDRLLRDINRRGDCVAVLAFGEFIAPGVTEAAHRLAAQGITRAVIVPLFLGGGLHVRSDVPKLAAQARAATGIKLRVARTIGEDSGVLRAMADYCMAAAPRARKRATSSRRKPS